MPLAIVLQRRIRIGTSYTSCEFRRAKSGQHAGNATWIARRTKNCMNARWTNRGKEVLQVHTPNDVLADMFASKRARRSTGTKPVCGRVNGNAIEDLVQDFPLNALQAKFRDLQHAKAAALGDESGRVMSKPFFRLTRIAALHIREPVELPDGDPKPIGHFQRSAQCGNIPAAIHVHDGRRPVDSANFHRQLFVGWIR